MTKSVRRLRLPEKYCLHNFRVFGFSWPEIQHRPNRLHAVNGVIVLQAGLFLSERDRQYLGKSVTDPTGIIVVCVQITVQLTEPVNNAFQNL